MNYLALVNKVLKRLREDEVTSVSQSTYAKLIGEFVNETKREVEDSWQWVLLRTTVQVTTSASTFRYELTGAGNRFVLRNAFNDTNDSFMNLARSEWMTQQFRTGTPQEGAPQFFDFNGTANDNPTVDVYPIPDGVYTLNFNMVIPQDDLVNDYDTLTVPEWPVVLGAYAKALSERGEDGGFQFREAVQKYEAALSDAIALDVANTQRETDWVQS